MKKVIAMVTLSGLFLLSHQPLNALTNGQVFKWTNGLAATCAALTYVWSSPTSPLALPFQRSPIGIKDGYTFPVVLTGVSYALSNRFFNWILSRYTPQRRYQWAQEEITDLETTYLFNKEITENNVAQILQESGAEASPVPLVFAFIRLQAFDNKLTSIIYELDRGISDEGDSDLSKNMNELLIKAYGYLKNVRANEALIKMQPHWNEQWKIHEHAAIEREKIAQHSKPQTHIHWHHD